MRAFTVMMRAKIIYASVESEDLLNFSINHAMDLLVSSNGSFNEVTVYISKTLAETSLISSRILDLANDMNIDPLRIKLVVVGLASDILDLLTIKALPSGLGISIVVGLSEWFDSFAWISSQFALFAMFLSQASEVTTFIEPCEKESGGSMNIIDRICF